MNAIHSQAARPSLRPFAAVPAAALLMLVLASCAQLQTIVGRPDAAPPPEAEPEAPEPTPVLEAQEKPAPPDVLWEWSGDGRRVTHIWIDVDEQRARFYEGAEQIGWTLIASGRKTHPTPVGKFAVMEKESKKRSNLYGKIYNAKGRIVKSNAKRGRDPIPPGGRFVGAKMPYFMRLTYDGIGLHAGPIPVPGSPASHGCIRMPGKVAPVLFRHVTVGTPVTVTGAGPNYGDYAEQQRAARATRAAAAPEPGSTDPAAGAGATSSPAGETPAMDDAQAAESDAVRLTAAEPAPRADSEPGSGDAAVRATPPSSSPREPPAAGEPHGADAGAVAQPTAVSTPVAGSAPGSLDATAGETFPSSSPGQPPAATASHGAAPEAVAPTAAEPAPRAVSSPADTPMPPELPPEPGAVNSAPMAAAAAEARSSPMPDAEPTPAPAAAGPVSGGPPAAAATAPPPSETADTSDLARRPEGDAD